MVWKATWRSCSWYFSIMRFLRLLFFSSRSIASRATSCRERERERESVCVCVRERESSARHHHGVITATSCHRQAVSTPCLAPPAEARLQQATAPSERNRDVYLYLYLYLYFIYTYRLGGHLGVLSSLVEPLGILQPAPASCQPHGRVRPFHQKSTCLTQSTLGPCGLLPSRPFLHTVYSISSHRIFHIGTFQ